MSEKESLNSTHRDVLKEIGNIGAAHSATALSSLLKMPINMSVPDVKVASVSEAINLIGGPDHVVVSVFLQVEGDIPSNLFFFLPLEEAYEFLQVMLDENISSIEQLRLSELALSALKELGNILSGSYVSSLSDFTNLSLLPSVPSLCIDMVGAVLSNGLLEVLQQSDSVIVIDTVLTRTELNKQPLVKGHFLLVPNPGSLQPIFTALGVADYDS
ncbi:chemotaxis protein CheC [Bacillus sp. CGMCC 1.16541]|uniref:chemotaxis protein CheC n=1 Tax=Bacillus sp. CGMCC 1.16541 TaxID=2185143 RepID=UPI000D72557C|nr:chemotaxis protein CheC [Bacillus sp. CGMCC 1.16541]